MKHSKKPRKLLGIYKAKREKLPPSRNSPNILLKEIKLTHVRNKTDVAREHLYE